MHAHVARLQIVGDPRQRERDPERRACRGGGDEDRNDALDATTAGEERPRKRRGAGEPDPEAGVRQEQRDREPVEEQDAFGSAANRGEPQGHRYPRCAEERKLVPVVDGRAEARDAVVVGVERRHAFRDERDEDERAEQESGALREPLTGDPRAGEHTHERKGGVDERAVRRRPCAIGRDRPERREPAPHGEAEERAEEEHGRARARRRAQQERRAEEQREAADQDERRIRGPAGAKKRAGSDECRAEHRQMAGDAFARSPHGR